MNAIVDTAEWSQTHDGTGATLCHLVALAGFVGIPFGNVLGPLIFWLVMREKYPEIDDHGKESLNFQLSMTIYTIVAGLCIFIIIGMFLLPVVLVTNLIFLIIASVKAGKGEFYRYPLTIRFVK